MADERLAIDRLLHVTEKYDPYIKREKLMQSVAEECARIAEQKGCFSAALAIMREFRLEKKP